MYARWSFSVTFNENYGNTPTEESVQINLTNGKVTKASPTRTHYNFGGWFTAKIGGIEVDLSRKVFEASITLYAHWTPYTVMFNLNYNNAPQLGSEESNQEGKVSKADPTRPSYIFNGWFTTTTGGTRIDLTTKVFDSATTLYAQWISEGKANSLLVSIEIVASSIQLSIASSLALSDLGAVIRLASETAPTKTEASANAGYVTLDVPANEERKFSISQHYGGVFTDELTLADVFSPNTAYKLYLYFPANNVTTATTDIMGISLTNDIGVVELTTESLPVATDTIWDTSLTANKYVASLSEWYYDTEQKGVFIAYTKVVQNFIGLNVNTRKLDRTLFKPIGTLTVGSVLPEGGYLLNIAKLGSAYPNVDNYQPTQKLLKTYDTIFAYNPLLYRLLGIIIIN